MLLVIGAHAVRPGSSHSRTAGRLAANTDSDLGLVVEYAGEGRKGEAARMQVRRAEGSSPVILKALLS